MDDFARWLENDTHFLIFLVSAVTVASAVPYLWFWWWTRRQGRRHRQSP